MLDLVDAFPGRTRLRRHRTFTDLGSKIMAKGYMRCDDKRRARKVGSDHHLTKLIDLPTLEKVLASIGAVPSRG